MNREQFEEFFRKKEGILFNDEQYNLLNYDKDTNIPLVSPLLRVVFEKKIHQRIDASYEKYVYHALNEHIQKHNIEHPKCVRILLGRKSQGEEKKVYAYLCAHVPAAYKDKLYVRTIDSSERDFDHWSVSIGIDTNEGMSKRALYDDLRVDFNGNQPIYLNNTHNGVVKIKVGNEPYKSFSIRKNKKNCFPEEAQEYVNSTGEKIRCSLWTTHTDKNRPYEDTNWILMSENNVFYIYSSDQIVELTSTIKLKVQV